MKKRLHRVLFVINILSHFNSLQLITQEPAHSCIIVSIPKSGTHLLGSLITHLTEHDILHPEHIGGNLLTLAPGLIEIARHQNKHLEGHFPANKENLTIFEQSHAKGIFIYRDPRDQIVSYAHWIKKNPTDFPKLAPLGMDELISYLIVREGQDYLEYMGWAQQKNVYAVKFENLVGSSGGGSEKEQMREITAIAQHLNIVITEQKTKEIAQQIFGGTVTFNKGKIGAWRDTFTQEHKQISKAVIGKLLIDLEYENDTLW